MSITGCCRHFMKAIVIGFNVIFGLIGAGFLLVGVIGCIGVLLVKDVRVPLSASGANIEKLFVAACVVLLVIGIVIIALSCLGCCAVAGEHATCLVVYSAILVTLLVLQLTVAVMIGVFSAKATHAVRKQLSQLVKDQYNQTGHEDITKTVDDIQSKLHCCGFHDGGKKWWAGTKWHEHHKDLWVPESCCIKDDKGNFKNITNCQSSNASSTVVYTDACGGALHHLIGRVVYGVIGSVVGFMLVQVLLIVVICQLKRTVPGYQSSHYQRI